MLKAIRTNYNSQFSPAAYEAMLEWIAQECGRPAKFSIAETPIFISPALKEHLLAASEDIIAVITQPDFAEKAQAALLPDQIVPNRTDRPLFIQMDFGLCQDEQGNIIPQLIEAQGFPSLYFFQGVLSEAYQRFMPVPKDRRSFFGDLDQPAYQSLLRQAILGDQSAEETILLEIEPHKQTTNIDFSAATRQIGIREVCISALILEGKSLFYDRDGVKTPVKRIYNRVIFDELLQRPDLKRSFNLTEEVAVEWAGHPDWFFMISKHSLPLFQSKYVPATYFLDQLPSIPADLENYVLKPLYSFAGAGVILNPTAADIAAISKPQHYILQRKVQYASLIPTPDVAAKAEIRLMYIWLPDSPRPVLVNNLVRLSKGEMVGVRYNKGKTWVGGSIGYH